MALSHHTVADEWLRGNEAKGLSVFTDGKSIWSYGRHFCLAHKVGYNKVLINTDSYSISTSKHQSIVRSAVCGSGKAIIECSTDEINHAANYPNEPVILKRDVITGHPWKITENLKTHYKNNGVKRFPAQKITEYIGKIVEMMGFKEKDHVIVTDESMDKLRVNNPDIEDLKVGKVIDVNPDGIRAIFGERSHTFRFDELVKISKKEAIARMI